MITLHMLLALVIVALLIYTIARSQREILSQIDTRLLPDKFKTVLIAAMIMTLLQVAMGTQVREAVDFIARENIDRQYWRDDFPIIFYIHRSFSSIILFTNLWLVWRTGLAVAVLVIIAILAGISLDRLGVPAIVQPIHLLMANLIFGAQFFLYSCLNYAATNQTQIVSPSVD
ncbi:MAG: cytochrome c oxidase assembly protein subunit 15 [Methylococcaceae bacterium NSO1]|nr:MAG: cytochrome c oxidase assembly protein subunit 15 [Methylococcaceae bacterium NSO1]